MGRPLPRLGEGARRLRGDLEPRLVEERRRRDGHGEAPEEALDAGEVAQGVDEEVSWFPMYSPPQSVDVFKVQASCSAVAQWPGASALIFRCGLDRFWRFSSIAPESRAIFCGCCACVCVRVCVCVCLCVFVDIQLDLCWTDKGSLQV